MPQRQSRLEGKVAIVTGAGSSGQGVGVGKATSILLAREGAKVLLVDQVIQRAEETQAMIREEGGEASVFEADVTRAEDCRAMADAAVARYGGLHVLVNNVGVSGKFGSVVEVTEENWHAVLDINLKSMVLTSKYAVPRMIQTGGGSIVNISSIAGMRLISVPGSVPYSVSKGGVIALTTTMAVQHGRDNIRVNCVAPGYIYTPMVTSLVTEEKRELRKRTAPLGTEGTAWDIAWAVVFLASDESRWISGIVLPVDAGVLATTPLVMLHHLQS